MYYSLVTPNSLQRRTLDPLQSRWCSYLKPLLSLLLSHAHFHFSTQASLLAEYFKASLVLTLVLPGVIKTHFPKRLSAFCLMQGAEERWGELFGMWSTREWLVETVCIGQTEPWKGYGLAGRLRAAVLREGLGKGWGCGSGAVFVSKHKVLEFKPQPCQKKKNIEEQKRLGSLSCGGCYRRWRKPILSC